MTPFPPPSGSPAASACRRSPATPGRCSRCRSYPSTSRRTCSQAWGREEELRDVSLSPRSKPRRARPEGGTAARRSCRRGRPGPGFVATPLRQAPSLWTRRPPARGPRRRRRGAAWKRRRQRGGGWPKGWRSLKCLTSLSPLLSFSLRLAWKHSSVSGADAGQRRYAYLQPRSRRDRDEVGRDLALSPAARALPRGWLRCPTRPPPHPPPARKRAPSWRAEAAASRARPMRALAAGGLRGQSCRVGRRRPRRKRRGRGRRRESATGASSSSRSPIGGLLATAVFLG